MVNRLILVPGANLISLVHLWGCEQLAESACSSTYRYWDFLLLSRHVWFFVRFEAWFTANENHFLIQIQINV